MVGAHSGVVPVGWEGDTVGIITGWGNLQCTGQPVAHGVGGLKFSGGDGRRMTEIKSGRGHPDFVVVET
jgi:hypothetical protein